jgi:hypothetical protein
MDKILSIKQWFMMQNIVINIVLKNYMTLNEFIVTKQIQ